MSTKFCFLEVNTDLSTSSTAACWSGLCFLGLERKVWSGERAALANASSCLSITASDRDGCVSLFSQQPEWPHSAASALISGLSLWLMVTLQMGHFPHMAPLEQTAQCEAQTKPPHLQWNHWARLCRQTDASCKSTAWICAIKTEWKHQKLKEGHILFCCCWWFKMKSAKCY